VVKRKRGGSNQTRSIARIAKNHTRSAFFGHSARHGGFAGDPSRAERFSWSGRVGGETPQPRCIRGRNTKCMATKRSDKMFYSSRLPLPPKHGESILFLLGTSQRPGHARVSQTSRRSSHRQVHQAQNSFRRINCESHSLQARRPHDLPGDVELPDGQTVGGFFRGYSFLHGRLLALRQRNY
jgi:hypothetical protein